MTRCVVVRAELNQARLYDLTTCCLFATARMKAAARGRATHIRGKTSDALHTMTHTMQLRKRSHQSSCVRMLRLFENLLRGSHLTQSPCVQDTNPITEFDHQAEIVSDE